MMSLYRRHLYTGLQQSGVPDSLHEGLVEYLADRRPTGRFLEAVLSNDLRAAASRADVVSRLHLYEIVSFLYNYAPAPCWGSPQAVAAWLTTTEAPPAVFE